MLGTYYVACTSIENISIFTVHFFANKQDRDVSISQNIFKSLKGVKNNLFMLIKFK